MDLQQLLNSITPAIYQQIQRAVEIGKWSDGRAITEQQRSLCMQAIIAYDQRMPEQQRTGYVAPKNTGCSTHAADEQKPIKWER